MSKRISQREAMRLRKQIRELKCAMENRRIIAHGEYAGTYLGKLTQVNTIIAAWVNTARKLDHFVTVHVDNENSLVFRAAKFEVER